MRHYKNIEGALLKRLEQKLLERGLAAQQVASEEQLNIKVHQNLLAFVIESVEFGFRHPFGRHTNVKVSYVFEDRDGRVITTGEYMEHSNKSWKNCVRTISQRIAEDIASRLAGEEMSVDQSRSGRKKATVAREGGFEERLRRLNELKAKGLVSEEEYAAKRKEILKDL